jgi:uncharacterized membrane protein YccC
MTCQFRWAKAGGPTRSRQYNRERRQLQALGQFLISEVLDLQETNPEVAAWEEVRAWPIPWEGG